MEGWMEGGRAGGREGERERGRIERDEARIAVGGNKARNAAR